MMFRSLPTCWLALILIMMLIFITTGCQNKNSYVFVPKYKTSESIIPVIENAENTIIAVLYFDTSELDEVMGYQHDPVFKKWRGERKTINKTQLQEVIASALVYQLKGAGFQAYAIQAKENVREGTSAIITGKIDKFTFNNRKEVVLVVTSWSEFVGNASLINNVTKDIVCTIDISQNDKGTDPLTTGGYVANNVLTKAIDDLCRNEQFLSAIKSCVRKNPSSNYNK